MSRPWMPLYVADYLADTSHLSAAQHGAYMLLIMHYWAKGGLPDDDVQLCRIARMERHEWEASRATLKAFFVSGWYHERIEKELADAKSAYERRAAAGRKGGSSNAKPDGKQCLSNAQAMLKQSQPQPDISLSLRSRDTREEKPKTANGEERAAQFERFWEIWPNKVGKKAASNAFYRVWREADAIIAGVERYISEKPPDRQWLNPATFLNQRRWEDAPAPVSNARAGPIREETSGVAKLLAEAYGFDRRNGNETAGNSANILALSVTHERVGTADYGDDGGIFRGLRRPDG